MASPEEIQDERRRARRVKLIADYTCSVIMQTHMARPEAEALVDAARLGILELFPGREETYELLYAPRFHRILDEFTTAGSSTDRGRLIKFPSPPSTAG
jgi:hypothetical protein